MRLFVALDIPDSIKDYLATIQKKFGNTTAKIAWVAKKNLHITLKFYGELPNNQTDTLANTLAKIPAPAITAQLTALGTFPPHGMPRVLWIGIQPDKSIINLQKTIDQETLGYGKQEHTFHTHLTLGRIKLIKDMHTFRKKTETLAITHHAFTFTHFTLYQSTLARSGPRYTPLKHYTLVP